MTQKLLGASILPVHAVWVSEPSTLLTSSHWNLRGKYTEPTVDYLPVYATEFLDIFKKGENEKIK